MGKSKHMVIDQQTRIDLEVFSSSHGDTGLFSLIDTTRTNGGREALKRRLKSPSSNAEEIVSIQTTLGFLRNCPIEFNLSAELMNTVDSYLHSRIEVHDWGAFGSKIQATTAVIRHGDIRCELSKGTAATIEFIGKFSGYCAQLQSRNPNLFLQKIVAKAIEVKEEIYSIHDLNRIPNGIFSLLKFDSKFRLKHKTKIQDLVALASEIDALISMADFGRSCGYSVPVVLEKGPVFEVEELVHPILENPIGYTTVLTGSSNTTYLTGPNMAGKTTFLKAVGLSILLAQAGMLVPAKMFRFTPYDCLFSGINTTDNLTAGVSYYLAEVERVKQAAGHLVKGWRSLMIFDEMFKGTNVLDATEATRLVVESCTAIEGSVFVFSSHLSELEKQLSAKGVRQASFTGEIQNGEPYYSYQIQKGVSDQRMGLILLEQSGVLDLMNEAKKLGVRDITT